MPALLSPPDALQALSGETLVPHPSDERTLARLVEWAGGPRRVGGFPGGGVRSAFRALDGRSGAGGRRAVRASGAGHSRRAHRRHGGLPHRPFRRRKRAERGRRVPRPPGMAREEARGELPAGGSGLGPLALRGRGRRSRACGDGAGPGPGDRAGEGAGSAGVRRGVRLGLFRGPIGGVRPDPALHRQRPSLSARTRPNVPRGPDRSHEGDSEADPRDRPRAGREGGHQRSGPS